MTFPVSTRICLLLVPLIPSILVSIFVLYHLLSVRALRTALNNHVIISLLSVGLIGEITSYVWIIHFYRTGSSLVSTPAFCIAWVFFDTAAYITVFLLMAWASIERHILIFHSHLFATKTKRLLFHYLPLSLSLLWPILFSFVTLVIMPCNTPFYYETRQCSRYACVIQIPKLALFDSITHYIIPSFITVIFSVSLFVRVIYHRYRIRRTIEWRSYKKMAIQLLSISVLYLLLQLPVMSLYAAYSVGLSRTIAANYYVDGLLFTNWIVLFTPFLCAVSLPELRKKSRNMILFWRKRHHVTPVTIGMTRQKADQVVPVALTGH